MIKSRRLRCSSMREMKNAYKFNRPREKTTWVIQAQIKG
jgi:hypothetical protein